MDGNDEYIFSILIVYWDNEDIYKNKCQSKLNIQLIILSFCHQFYFYVFFLQSEMKQIKGTKIKRYKINFCYNIDFLI